jgi:hypothetical protein
MVFLSRASVLLIALTPFVESFVMPSHPVQRSTALHATHDNGRREFLSAVAALAFPIAVIPQIANAGIDPSLLRNIPVEGDTSGQAMRLRQIDAVQRPETDLQNIPFVELPSGVSFREYREGKGDSGALYLCRDITIRLHQQRLDNKHRFVCVCSCQGGVQGFSRNDYSMQKYGHSNGTGRFKILFDKG